MKAFALAVAVAAGVICSAGTADAQYRARGSYRYYTPTYVAPTYSYPTYSYPSTVGTGVVTSGYTPAIGSTVYPASYYSTSPVYYGSSYYTYPNYYGNSYYTPGMNITPAGMNWNGRRVWRW